MRASGIAGECKGKDGAGAAIPALHRRAQARFSRATVAALLLLIALSFPAPAAPLEYGIGADLSFLKQQEDAGKRFKDQGQALPALDIFRKHGYGWVRLRLFHTPSNSRVPLPNSLAYTLASAKQAKARGFRLLLDFHYSDTWADPGDQQVPKAWAGLPHAALIDSVQAYTRDVIARFGAEGVMPDMVQIGNEINNGMLWPDGKDDWNRLADLIKAGIRGVDGGRGGAPMPAVMLHIACGGDTAVTGWFFDNAEKSGIAYDVIGQSYYPLWQGTPADLGRNLAFMAGRYAKDIIVVETAFTPYPAGFPGGGGPFPLTDAGQGDYLREIDRLVRAAPGGRGKGWMWWEPTGDEYLGTPRGLFDRQLNARPALAVFDGQVSLQRPRAGSGRLEAFRSAYGGYGSFGGGGPGDHWTHGTGIRLGLPPGQASAGGGYRFYTVLGQDLPGFAGPLHGWK